MAEADTRMTQVRGSIDPTAAAVASEDTAANDTRIGRQRLVYTECVFDLAVAQYTVCSIQQKQQQ